MSMSATIFDCDLVSVSDLAVTVESDAGRVTVHSADPDFALRLAEALVTAHSRRTVEACGKSAIVSKPRGRWLGPGVYATPQHEVAGDWWQDWATDLAIDHAIESA